MEDKSINNELGEVIYNQIHEMFDDSEVKKPIIIGINGVDTSGKTRFSKKLRTFLRNRGEEAEIIHLDDFHNHSSLRRQGRDEITAYINNAFNLEKLEKKVLKEIKEKGKLNIELELLDLGTDTFTNKRKYNISENTIVILEGVLLYRKPIDEYLDYRIFIDIDFNEVIKRAKSRDVPIFGKSIISKYKNKYIPIQKWYLDTYKPRKKANIVINNNDYNHPKIKYIK
ncbi:P-loop NTPase fold protein [Sporosalibacterium faouarense]|uniref:P-loop NTPase fold protein n=1 Tax=Sporosalibacterium faouarense TaxID=516123 RepID=UPI00141CBEA6|nr:P-loop NTPase fold protein [Sporosalibacterium faouarense]MTI49769.1 hypothetical protein [Bacillota bacterium]